MTELQTSVVTLDSGLDLSTSKVAANPGSLLSCRNYEVTDTQGLSRIDGYEPYDAQCSPSLTSLYRVVMVSSPTVAVGDIICVQSVIIGTETLTSSYLLADGDFLVNGSDSIIWEPDSVSGGGSGSSTTVAKVLGKVTSIDLLNNTFWMMVSNLDLLNAQATMYVLNESTGALGSALPVVSTITSGRDVYEDEDDYYQALLTASATLRADISSLGYPAAGLHFFRDTLYAVAPLRQYLINAVDNSNVIIAGNWTHTLTVGTWVGNSSNSAVAYVNEVTSVTDGGTSVETMYLEVSESDSVAWDAAIAANASITGTGFAAGGAATATKLIISSVRLNTNSVTGTLWRCRDPQLDINDGTDKIDLGWYPINLGFSAPFNTGDSADDPIKMERSIAEAPTSATYYLYDGVNKYSVTLVSYFVSSGAWVDGDAAGYLQFKDITVVAGSLVEIDEDFNLYSDLAVTTKVAELTDAMTYNYLVLNPDLVEAGTRYEFETANFFADATWDAFYGVNGVERAFYYTGTLFAKIYTQATLAKDNPRHVAYHLGHLALGFYVGSVQLSVSGLPHDFNGTNGATEIGMGDRVVGLMPLNSDTLGVFCQQSIRAITGSFIDEFVAKVIAPKTGCIEYTLVNIGTPVYCNSSGIVSLDQSEKYGNYVGMPLSYKVNSFLRPRLNRVSGRYSPKSGVVAAMPVRAKNQYRLFFKDGQCLTMTIPGDGGEAKFTQQDLTFYDGDVTNTIVPFAISSQTDANGEEVLHFSHYDTKTGNYSDYVYELDKGWGQSGEPIEHEFETNWFAGESPNTFFSVRKIRVHGITRGRASLKISASGTQNLYESEYNTTEEPIDLPRTPVHFDNVGVPSTNSANLANRGMAIQLKFENRELTSPEPSHICQVLVLQTTPGGKTDA